MQHNWCHDIEQLPAKKTFKTVQLQERLQDREPTEEKHTTPFTQTLSHLNLVLKTERRIKIIGVLQTFY